LRRDLWRFGIDTNTTNQIIDSPAEITLTEPAEFSYKLSSYLAWEDGVNLLMAALGVRVPEADEGPWFDACWRVAHNYIDAYDGAAQAQPSDPAPTPTAARTSPWPNRSPSSSTSPDPTAASTSPRTATAT
jgi:hypothetical protein